jgi:hypothetical protein
MSQELRLIRRITLKLIPFLILLYLIAYVDRSAVGFAKLHMGADVGIGTPPMAWARACSLSATSCSRFPAT